MLKNWASLSTIGTTLVLGSLQGWGKHTHDQQFFSNPSNNVQVKDRSEHFPFNLDQQWYAKETYILWKPSFDDIEYANFVSQPDTETFKTKSHNPHYQWSSGFRFAIGKYLPNHQQWDIDAVMTYYNTEAKNSVRADLENTTLITPVWAFQELGASSDSSVKFNMTFFIWDLLMGRNYSLTSKLRLHPYLSLRSVLLNQAYRNKNSGLFQELATGQLVKANTKFKAENRFWGLGPRIGTNFDYGFGHGWSFLGELSASFLCGHYHIDQHINGKIQATGLPDLLLHLKDGDTVLRSNIETSIGIGWEKWVNNHTVRIAPSFMVEASEWFSMNHWMTTQIPFRDADHLILTDRHYGNLAFWGFSFNLQVDF